MLAAVWLHNRSDSRSVPDHNADRRTLAFGSSRMKISVAPQQQQPFVPTHKLDKLCNYVHLCVLSLWNCRGPRWILFVPLRS